ncbi:hypothetical protein HDK77DRAFT_457213 [Phyllosticta capitalensis]
MQEHRNWKMFHLCLYSCLDRDLCYGDGAQQEKCFDGWLDGSEALNSSLPSAYTGRIQPFAYANCQPPNKMPYRQRVNQRHSNPCSPTLFSQPPASLGIMTVSGGTQQSFSSLPTPHCISRGSSRTAGRKSQFPVLSNTRLPSTVAKASYLGRLQAPPRPGAKQAGSHHLNCRRCLSLRLPVRRSKQTSAPSTFARPWRLWRAGSE